MLKKLVQFLFSSDRVLCVSRGFSLIESLVVVGITGIVMAAAASMFASQSRAYRQATAARGMFEYSGMALKQISTHLRGAGWSQFGQAVGGGVTFNPLCGAAPQGACGITVTTFDSLVGYRWDDVEDALERCLGTDCDSKAPKYANWVGPETPGDTLTPSVTAFQVNCFSLAVGDRIACSSTGVGRLEVVMTASHKVEGRTLSRTFTSSVVPPSAYGGATGGGAPRSPF